MATNRYDRYIFTSDEFLDSTGFMTDVTRILSQIESGDPSAAEKLLRLVYDELRQLAAAKLAHEKPGKPLSHCAYPGRKRSRCRSTTSSNQRT